MLILFDQGTPVPLRQVLTNHEVRTTAEQQWNTLENRQLLEAAAANGFDVLITTDKNIRYQQNLARRRIAIVVLLESRWPILRNYVQRVVFAVATASPGSCTEIEIT